MGDTLDDKLVLIGELLADGTLDAPAIEPLVELLNSVADSILQWWREDDREIGRGVGN